MLATKYYDANFVVLPCKPNTKEPACQWARLQYQRPSQDELQAIWTTAAKKYGTKLNIAVVCGKVSGIVVLDIDDPEKFGIALKTLNENLPDTPVVRTRKGWHVYFRYPANRIVRRHDRLSDWGAELRGDGCYVVAPPSIVDGHRYTWAKRNGKLMSPEQVPIADCPDWLLDAFGVPYADEQKPPSFNGNGHRNGHGSLTPEQKQALKAILVQHWIEGQRHDLALGLAGLLAKSSIAQDDALSLLREIAAEAKDNEWRDRERALKDTFDRLWKGETVIGFKRLEDILGDQTAEVIASIVAPRKGTNGKANTTVELLTLSEWDERLSYITQGQWLVDGFLQVGWLLVINARPKVGKSIVSVNLATALAKGTPFLNLQTEPCTVVYVDLERPIETLKRFKVLGALDNPNIFVPSERLGADRLDVLQDLIRQAKERTGRPVVVFVDTLGDFIKPATRQRRASINDYDAIAEILQELRDLALELGCAFVFVHHTRKAQSDEPSEVDVLGSTAIAGKFDVIAHLQPDRTDASVLSLVAEGNAIAKTTLYFAIEDNFKLSPCEPPAKTKEEQASREIRWLLERNPEGMSRTQIVRYLLDIGLAETPEGAQSLFRRASANLALETKRNGKSVLYSLPARRVFEPDIGHHGQGIEFDQSDQCCEKAQQNKAENIGHDIGQPTDHDDQCWSATMVNMVTMVNDSMTNVTKVTNVPSDIGQSPEDHDHYRDHYEKPNKTRRFGEHWSHWSNTIQVTNDQCPEPSYETLREDELQDTETLLSHAPEPDNSETDGQENGNLVDTEAFISEYLAENDDGEIEPEPFVAAFAEPEKSSMPDGLACLCGGRLKLVGKTYKCPSCANPRPVACRRCGRVLHVIAVGQATCSGCGLAYAFDRERYIWLSDGDPF